MRIAIIGQQDFGKAVLEAFVNRADTIAGVFCAPEKPGAKSDPLRIAAEQAHIVVHQLSSLKTEEACEALRSLAFLAASAAAPIPRPRASRRVNLSVIISFDDFSFGVRTINCSDRDPCRQAAIGAMWYSAAPRG